MALSKDGNSAIVRLEHIVLWKNNKPDPDGDVVVAGREDKIFRLDGVDAQECASLAADSGELAALPER